MDEVLDLGDGTVAATSPTLAGGVSSATPSGRIFVVAGTTLTALQPS